MNNSHRGSLHLLLEQFNNMTKGACCWNSIGTNINTMSSSLRRRVEVRYSWDTLRAGPGPTPRQSFQSAVRTDRETNQTEATRTGTEVYAVLPRPVFQCAPEIGG